MIATATTASHTPALPADVPQRQDREQLPVIDARDLVAPLGCRRGVHAHAADWLSRMERRRTYLPI
jgi:hypothetical protein